MQSAFTPKQLNQILSNLMGRKINLGYQGNDIPMQSTGGANMDPKTGKVHLSKDWYKALAGAPKVSSGLALAIGILSHELGWMGSGYKGNMNTTGGLDWSFKDGSQAADDWGYQNMQRIVSSLGLRPQFAGKASKALRTYRKSHPVTLP